MSPRKKPAKSNSATSTPKAPRQEPGKKVKKIVYTRARAGFEGNFWKENLIPLVLIFVAALALYGMTANYEYVLDDKIVLSENKFVKQGTDGIGLIFGEDTFKGYFSEKGITDTDLLEGGRYRPLSLVTFAIEYSMWGLDPGKSHLMNVLLYGLTGLLIFRILSLFFPMGEKRNWWMHIPFLVSILFILHPIHSEVVANIKGRDEILALLLSLSVIWATWKWLATQKGLWMGVSAVLFLFALLAKENSLTFLAVVPLAVWTFATTDKKALAMVSVPLLVTTVVYFMIRHHALGFFFGSGTEVSSLMNNPFVDATLNERFGTVFYTLFMYLKLQIFPHPLTHDYYPYQVPLVGMTHIFAILGLLLSVGGGIWAVWSLRNRSVGAFSVLYYLATLSIVSNFFFTVGTFMNERFVYMPSLGFLLLLVWILVKRVPEWLGTNEKIKWLSLGLLGLMAVGFVLKTYERTPAWENGQSLNEAAVTVSTNSARANNMYGVVLYNKAQALQNDRALQQKLYRQSIPYFERALEIYPEYLDALRMRAGAYGGLYTINNEVDTVLDVFEATLRVRHVPYVDQFLVYMNGRRRHIPQMTDFYYTVGYEVFWKEQQNSQLAHQYLDYGLQLDPNNVRLHVGKAEVFMATGKNTEALRHVGMGLAVEPNNVRLQEIARSAGY